MSESGTEVNAPHDETKVSVELMAVVHIDREYWEFRPDGKPVFKSLRSSSVDFRGGQTKWKDIGMFDTDAVFPLMISIETLNDDVHVDRIIRNLALDESVREFLSYKLIALREELP